MMTSNSDKPQGYAYRVEFHFVNQDQQLQRSKTWQLWQGAQDPPRTLLLHVNARLLSRLPAFRELASNHASFTFTVADLSGDLVARSYPGVASAEDLTGEIGRHPLTIGVTLKTRGLDFSVHVGQADA